MTVDGAGNYYIADAENSRIRRIDASTGIVTTFAAGLYNPYAVAFDVANNLYITGRSAIRAVKDVGRGGAPAAPRITGVSYVRKKLTISGENFGETGAVVRVNGSDVSARLRKQNDTKLVLHGSTDDLGLQTGSNEITVTEGGRTSAVFVFTR